jgi:hypothetical protein
MKEKDIDVESSLNFFNMNQLQLKKEGVMKEGGERSTIINPWDSSYMFPFTRVGTGGGCTVRVQRRNFFVFLCMRI